MKILIFGSTGTIGRQLVRQALDLGYTVTAFARTPHKLEDLKHPHLHFHQGDVLDYTSVTKAIEGHDAVLCALGAGKKGKVRAEGTLNIIRAMEKTGVRRFICQTTLGAGDSEGNLNFLWKNILFGIFLRKALKDHELQEKYIMESQLDWTIVRPSAFTDREMSGNYQHGFSSDNKTLQLKIPRSDVADFMLRQLTDNTYLHKTPAISY